MCPYYDLSEEYWTIFEIAWPCVSPENTLIIGEHILYPNPDTNGIAIVSIRESGVHRLLPLSEEFINLENVEVMKEVSSFSHQSYAIIIVTDEKVCLFEISKDFEKICYLGETFCLGRFAPNEIEQDNKNGYQLLNIQSLIIEEKEAKTFIIAGYDRHQRLIVNVFFLKRNEKEVEHMTIEWKSQCGLEPHKDMKNSLIYSFTLCMLYNSFPIVFAFPIYQEKGLAVPIYQYNLTPMLNQSNEMFWIATEEIVHQLGCLHNFFHINNVYQVKDDLYICYTRYVPFTKDKKTGNCEEAKPQAHVLVYNTGIGYTKNIIDLQGPIIKSGLIYSTIGDEENYLIISSQNESTLIKMDSQNYQPNFTVKTIGQAIHYSDSSYFITLNMETDNRKIFSHFQSSPTLILHKKISKNVLYCCMLESIGFPGGENFVHEVLSILK